LAPASGRMADLYVIRDWDEHFENARTLRIKGGLPRIMLPTRLSKDGYIDLLTHPNGPGHFGSWAALLQVAANCRPRGELRRDSGEPHTIASLSRMTRIPEKTLTSAIERLCDDPIRWMDRLGTASGPDMVPIGTSEAKGSEGNVSECDTRTDRILRFTALWNKATTGRNVRRLIKTPTASSDRGKGILRFIDACGGKVNLIAASIDTAMAQEWIAEIADPLRIDWFLRRKNQDKHLEMGLECLNGSPQ